MSDRISLVNQIWPNKRRDGRNARENGGPREQLRFVRALACGRAAKKSVKPKQGGNGMEDKPSFVRERPTLGRGARGGEGKKVGKKGLFELSLCAKQPPGFSGTRQTRFPLLLLLLFLLLLLPPPCVLPRMCRDRRREDRKNGVIPLFVDSVEIGNLGVNKNARTFNYFLENNDATRRIVIFRIGRMFRNT